MVNIHECDVVDGRPTTILGLIWAIILHVHFDVRMKRDLHERNKFEFELSNDKMTAMNVSLRRYLIDFFKSRFGIDISDFGSSWCDGWLLLEIAKRMKPSIQLIDGVGVMSPSQRLNYAFDLLNDHFGVNKLMDSNDVNINNPDERLFQIYLMI